MRINRRLAILSVWLCILPIVSMASGDPVHVVNEYLLALQAHDWARAESFWRTDLVEKSKRLAIRYQGIHAKYDCASPAVLYADDIDDGRLSVHVARSGKNPDYAVVKLTVASRKDTLDYDYYLESSGDRWYITSPVYLFTESRPRFSTRYLNIVSNDSALMNTYATEKLDRFVRETAERMLFTPEQIRVLESDKIDYVLCTEKQFVAITGVSAQGLGNLQFDAVITRHSSHYHELAHILMNFALGDSHLYTLPFLQEGFAVALGGRWGRAKATILQLGYTILTNELIQPEDVFTVDGFHHEVGTPEISYPVSGLLTEMILTKYGPERYLELYRQLSGTYQDIHSLSRTDVISKMERILGRQWPDIHRELMQYADRYADGGLTPGGSHADVPPMMSISDSALAIRIWESDDSYLVEVTARTKSPEGVLLLTPRERVIRPGYSSRLYHEHTGMDDFHSEQYGILFTPEEVGIYDYYTDLLIAKYAMGFDPSDEYLSENRMSLTFRIDGQCITNPLEAYDCRVVLR